MVFDAKKYREEHKDRQAILHKKHRETSNYKETLKKYHNTDSYKDSLKKSRNKPERKEYQKNYLKEYRKTHPSNDYHKKYRVSNKGKIILSKAHLKFNFGITNEEYNKMLASQYCKCIGCNRMIHEFKRKFAVDHDHTTGKIRGLLCIHCNLILGHAKDNEITLLNLVEHLRKSRNS